MMYVIKLSTLALAAVATLSACAPTTKTLAQFNAEHAGQRAVGQLGESVRQSAERRPYGRGTPEQRASCPTC